jgi:predicted metalloprotease with PDZ domain
MNPKLRTKPLTLKVTEGSPAAAAGLRLGDQIISFGGVTGNDGEPKALNPRP